MTRLPKLSLACDAATHLILAATGSTGGGADQPSLTACCSTPGGAGARACACVATDAGFDSEDNHGIARRDIRVRSVIPPKVGRPTQKPRATDAGGTCTAASNGAPTARSTGSVGRAKP